MAKGKKLTDRGRGEIEALSSTGMTSRAIVIKIGKSKTVVKNFFKLKDNYGKKNTGGRPKACPRVMKELIVLGTPAEEGGGGKLRLIELGAFKEVDIAMMAHPTRINAAAPPFLAIVDATVEYKGKEAHASASPWKGRNALDAAVACYQNIALLRQHIKPRCKIHAVITKGGIIPNIIPAESCLELFVRAPNRVELRELETRVEACITSAATATGCEVTYNFADQDCYENLITNKVLGNLYQTYAERLGAKFIKDISEMSSIGSTDMGNVSHIIPSIHPLFSICTEAANHTKAFTKASGAPEAQEPTLNAAKAMAMTALAVLRSQETLDEVKREFSSNIQNNLQYQ
ncbi:peptidase M20 domain-containing protein 2-like [Stegodyphus dumicola]|uniref:peptidase M20 domain-containing protein 2-like n=1 Tax=Stegodyphus dumicola TaxID=202533 RepID=UPI0015A81845|nr:peptidase M20 domain-containing protein 2-like [Stegodyphus dumicola]